MSLASQVLALRFKYYRHAVLLARHHTRDGVHFESRRRWSLWLRPRENYLVYLRESRYDYAQKQIVVQETAEQVFDGDPTDHVVAIALLARRLNQMEVRINVGFGG
jgi:hypothetical protein